MAILKRKELFWWHVLHYRILSTPTKEKGKSPLWMKGLIYRHAVLLITGLILLLCRWHIMGSSTPVFQVVDNPASFEKSFIMRVSETPVLRCSTIKYHSQGCWMLIFQKHIIIVQIKLKKLFMPIWIEKTTTKTKKKQKKVTLLHDTDQNALLILKWAFPH